MRKYLSRSTWAWYGLALVCLVLDQVTKFVATEQLVYANRVAITSFFNFTLSHNPGAAFSFLSDAGGWQRWFFGVIASVVSVVLVVWIARLGDTKRFEACALALVLSGAIGNLYDRMAYGYVIDFIEVHYQHHYWPVFNIADSAICIGAAMLLWDMFRTGNGVDRKSSENEQVNISSQEKSND